MGNAIPRFLFGLATGLGLAKSMRREEVRDAVEICRFEHLSLYPLFNPDFIGFRFFIKPVTV
jgi:hypothetical protein